MKVTAAEKIEALEKAIRNLAYYRAHLNSCAFSRTDFCTCGLREAMEVSRAAMAMEVSNG